MSDRPLYAVIMAGGQGTRFWPISRRSRPKQFLPLISGRSLLEATAARLAAMLPWPQIVVVATAGQEPLVREAVPDLPSENLLVEPAGRNTAPCLALAAVSIAARCPEALMTALPADHHIAPREAFLSVLRSASRLVEQTDEVVTIGIRPTWASTGYGYLEAGESAEVVEGCVARRLVTFHEKPPSDRAASFIRTGRYFWNAGIFILSVSRAMELLGEHVPAIGRLMSQLRLVQGTAADAALRATYAGLSAVSFDKGVMEKYTGGYLVEAAFEWSDVGSWDAMAEMWADESGNRVAGKALAVEAANCAVYSPDRLVALVGVEGLVIVDSGDALLVCRKGETERVRDVVARLHGQGRDELL